MASRLLEEQMKDIARMLRTGCLGWCLLALGAACFSAKAETNAVGISQALMRRGTEADRAGRAVEAIAAYEALLRNDSRFESVVAPRLVKLYGDRGQAADALAWAARVARRQPAPKAYLAGIYQRLGQKQEAELLLRQAISESRTPDQRVPLFWQLADLQESMGEKDAACETLTVTCDTAHEAALKKTSRQRLDALRKRCAQPRPDETVPCSRSKVEVKP